MPITSIDVVEAFDRRACTGATNSKSKLICNADESKVRSLCKQGGLLSLGGELSKVEREDLANFAKGIKTECCAVCDLNR